MSILAPHKEQASSVYIRVYRLPEKAATSLPHVGAGTVYVPGDNYFVPCRSGYDIAVSYDDSRPPCRVISSRRVEENVETGAYLKRCADEGIGAVQGMSGKWWVGRRAAVGCGSFYSVTLDPAECGPTLREAYYRFKAATR